MNFIFILIVQSVHHILQTIVQTVKILNMMSVNPIMMSIHIARKGMRYFYRTLNQTNARSLNQNGKRIETKDESPSEI